MSTAEIQKATNYMMCCENCMCMMQVQYFSCGLVFGLE